MAACIGNVLEWYDFAIFGAFVREISANFFPAPACVRPPARAKADSRCSRCRRLLPARPSCPR